MARRCSRNSHPRAAPHQEVEEGEDVLVELLGILVQGPSQWYTLNGDTSTQVSLCRVLGFFSETDYYAFLVHKNLAEYRFNKAFVKMELRLPPNEWRSYLDNKRYTVKLSFNAEIEKKKIDINSMLSGKKQSDSQGYNYHVLRLGSRESESYAQTISSQKVWLPKIPGWSAKQRYFRRKVDDAVLSIQLENDHLYEQLLEELDKNSLPSPNEDDLAATGESPT